MVLQKGNVGRLFLWDKHRIIHNYFLVKVFVPMANSFQMIKHDSKTIQLKKTAVNLGHSFAIQKHFQGWPLLYRAQSWFKAVMY